MGPDPIRIKKLFPYTGTLLKHNEDLGATTKVPKSSSRFQLEALSKFEVAVRCVTNIRV